MILVVDALNKHKFKGLLRDMFALRKRVFHDRMGWEVKIENGMEIDEFDALDPAYILCLDDNYRVVGCARLLQTTGPHMLSDVFDDILDGEAPLRSVTIWESTRFCVDRERLAKGVARNSVAYATSELMVGTLEYAQEAGMSDIITVIDPVMDRVLKRSDNAPYAYVGKTADMGKVKALAALIDCTDERIEKVRAFAGVEGDVFLKEDEVAASLQPLSEEDLSVKLTTYCADQIATASDEEERIAAMALRQALTEMLRSRRNLNA